MSENEVVQGTKEWLDARAGHVTASRIGDVMAKPRKGQKDSLARQDYMTQLVFERISKKSLEEDRSSFWDVKRGTQLESSARVEYEMRNSVDAVTAGFVKHPTLLWAGCSPDCLIGENGMAQFKCPRRRIHWDWIKHGVVPSEHRDQMLFELACTGREWSDFVSYVDELEGFPHLQLFQVRLFRDEVRIQEIEVAVAKFNAEVEADMLKAPTGEGGTSLQEQLEQSLKIVKGGRAEK